tara:strand:- start:598 stop:951 length:354 start_codon:yes stop_codon:yes gene_type:complete
MQVLCKSFLILRTSSHIQIINKHNAYSIKWLQSLYVDFATNFYFFLPFKIFIVAPLISPYLMPYVAINLFTSFIASAFNAASLSACSISIFLSISLTVLIPTLPLIMYQSFYFFFNL